MNKKITKGLTGIFFRVIAPLMVLAIVVSSYAALVSPSRHAAAATSSTINFQARLMTASGAIVPDGYYNVEFKLYNALSSSGSSQGSCTGDTACLWTETRTGGNKVRVANGYLSVELGSITALPTSTDWSQNLYLTMNIGGTATSPSWDGEMSPRLHLTAIPYAFTAGKLSKTNGSNIATLDFVQPTATRSILLPDESGTVCLQNSTNCGFALSSGGTNYIQNQNSSDQTANFRISGTGRANTSLQAPLFDTPSGTTLAIGTTNATAISLDKSTTITGGLTQSGGAISLTGNAASSLITTSNNALSVRAGGTAILTLNTSGAGTVNVGTDNTINVNIGGGTDVARTIRVGDPQSAGTAAQTVSVGSQRSTSTTTIQGGNGSSAIALNTATNGSINLTTTGTGKINLTTGTAGVVVKPTTDNGAVFQVQNAAGGYILNVDTSSNTVGLGTLLVTAPSLFDANIDTYFNGDLGIGTSTATALNMGHAGSTVTIQGDSSSTFKATSGSFTTTLGFTTPTANRTINLPNESGTVCLQGSSACSFAPASGSANYIQNATAAQSANFYVQAASSGSVAGVIRANAAGAGDILQLKNGAGTNVATFGSTGAILLQNTTNSTAAFQVSASAGAGGNAILRVDSTNERVAVGVISDPIGAKLSIATSSTVGFRVFQGGSSDAIQAGNATADFFSMSSTGNTLLKPTTNSTTAFRIQNANASVTLLTADTSNSRIAIGQTSASYTLDVAGDINSTTALRVGGNLVCDSTGCNAKSGSGFYIHNQTTAQSANMYVQAATSGSVAGIFQANASGAGDILQLKNGAGTNVATVSSTGAAAFRNSANSATAFQVQNTAGGQLLNVDTSANIITLNGNNSAALNTWQSTSSLSSATSFAGLTVANGYAYSIGGYGSGYTTTVQYAKINANGTLGSWAATTALPEARAYTTAVTAGGYIYVLGGTTGSASANTVYVGKVSSDGKIANWQESSVTLPAALNAISATVSGGYLYILGGTGAGGTVSTTYYSLINGDGSLDGFQSGTALPVALANAQALVANGYIYFIGGYTGSSAVATVYYASLNTSTGAMGSWTATSSLPSNHNNFGATISNGYMYTYKTGSVYYAPLNTNGTLGTWATDANALPVNYNGTNSFTYNGYHYLIGGYTGSVGTTGVYYASGSRTYVAGTLDLVGLTQQGGGNGDDSGGNGSAGGALIAGNTNVMGTLQVQGQSNFAQNVSMEGSLTVGNDVDDDDALITVTSRRYAGIHLLSDMGNTSGEIGGAYVLYGQDAWGTRAITGMVQTADLSPQGDDYTGSLANAFLMGIYNNFALQLGTNSIVRLTIQGNGNVCIATTSCTKKLGVSGTIGASGTITASTTPDLAETIPAAPDVEAADVVMADPNNSERAVKSDRAYNTAAIGVISDGTSSFMINARANSPDAPLTGKPLVLVGRVPVKVTNEGGAIRPGDLLTSASKPGYAMKATKVGPTIGTALGSFSGTEGEVLVFVNLGYHDSRPGLQGGPDSANFANLNVSGDATIHKLTVSGVTVNGNGLFTGDITVGGTVTTGSIIVKEHIVTKGAAPQIQLQASAGTNASATITGNDTAGVITITMGDNPNVDALSKVIFAKGYDADARVMLTPIGRQSAAALPYVDYANGTEFMLGIGQNVPAGTILKYGYQVMQ